MTTSLVDISWPASRLGEALEALARCCRVGIHDSKIEAPPLSVAVEGGGTFERWIEASAQWLGLESEPVESPYADVERLLDRAGPALLHVSDGGVMRFLALAGSNRGQLVFLTPEQSTARRGLEAVRAAVCGKLEAPAACEVEQILTRAGISGRRRQRARKALLGKLLAGSRVGGCWLIRCAPATGFVAQAREARLPGLLFGLFAATSMEYVLWLLSWWLLGWMALEGRFEPGWLLAWVFLLLGIIPSRLLGTSAGGLLAIRAGLVLKRRLLAGALKLEPDIVRQLGVGQLLGRVIESEIVEGLAISGGFLGVTAIIELTLAAVVLGGGAGWLPLLLLGVWGIGTVLFFVRYYRCRQRWTADRLDMTNDLVERMIGHRTRLAQQNRADWHEGEDQALERYLGVSGAMDRTAVALQALIPRGWFIVGLLGLAPVFLAGNQTTAALAVGLGGVVLAYRAFYNLTQSLEQVTGAAIAWQRIKQFWQAAATHELLGHPNFAAGHHDGSGEPSLAGRTSLLTRPPPLLDARGLAFRYRDRATPVFQGVNVLIHAGDRLLLEGPSGGGKSTLAAVLAGYRVPDSGLLLLDGLDRQSLGADSWRRRVVFVPQFHENHILMGTLAFNLLMGKHWPPQPVDLEDAESLCRALGLGPLLDRMPAGIHQLVGETGWQLSQGEKSRLYMARALLQGADIILFDESFGALDPQTLQDSLALVLQRVRTIVVIAHP